MTFGEPGTEGSRVHDLKDVEAILDVFQKHGHDEVRYEPLSFVTFCSSMFHNMP